MGASFRNVSQILELVGCDLLTISPELMNELSESSAPVERKLDPARVKSVDMQRLELDEKRFRYLLNEDAMATEKTAEGIRKFVADMAKLEKLVASRIS
jgi:transaldolase